MEPTAETGTRKYEVKGNNKVALRGEAVENVDSSAGGARADWAGERPLNSRHKVVHYENLNPILDSGHVKHCCFLCRPLMG